MTRIGRLNDSLNKPSRKVLGLMSGTSVDAIDAALTEIEGHGPEATVSLIAFDSFPFPAEVRARIFKLFDPGPHGLESFDHGGDSIGLLHPQFHGAPHFKSPSCESARDRKARQFVDYGGNVGSREADAS